MSSFLRHIILAALILSISYSFGQAPTISYGGPQSYLINTQVSLSPSSNGVSAPGYSNSPVLLGSGFSSPSGVHVDVAGNIYVSSFYETTAKIIPVGSNTPVAIGSGFAQPFDITTDAAGNVYVADLGNNAVKKIPAGSNTPITIGSGFMQPAGVAVAADGTVYVADYGHSLVKKIAPGGSPVSIGSGFSTPTGVAVDAFGNVYVADYGNNAIKKIPAGSNTPTSIGSGFSLPNGVAVDASGNVFVADFGSKTVREILVSNGSTITLNVGTINPYKVAIDASGNLLIADFSRTSIEKSIPSGGYYIDKPLPVGLTLNGATGVISGTPTVTSPATVYTITAYNSHGGTATHVNIQVKLPAPPTISYSSPQSYLLNTLVNLSPASSGVALQAYGSTPVLLGSGFSSPTGIAVDAAGNVYVSSFYQSTLQKIPVGGGAPVPVGMGFTQPFDVAIDAAGNLYVADLGNNAVKKIPAGSNTPVTIGSGFSQPAGVAIDAAGNVFVADYGHNAVKKILASNGSVITIGSGFATPTGVAVDAYGNVYVADYGNNAIKKIPVGSNTPVSIGTGISLPNGVAVDASGNVFEADYGTNTVREILAGGNTTITVNSGAINPYKITTDGSGNLFVADFSTPSVKKVIPSGGFYISKPLPLGLTFNNATGIISGTALTASPATIYTVTAYNTGGGTSFDVSLQIALPPPPTISYNTPQSYLVASPASLSPSSSNVSAPGFSAIPVLLGSGFSSPTGVAVDAAGNVYVSSFYKSIIEKIPAGGGAPLPIGSGFTQPFDVAIDAAGNLYIADLGNNAVKKIPAGSNTPVTIGSGFAQPAGVAVNAAGDVYIADYGNNAVKMIPAGSNTPVAIGSGFATPTGVAVDAYGNVYVADYGNNAIKKIPAGSNTPVSIGTGISLPNGVRVDNEGNVFEADYGTNTIREILAGTNTTITISSGLINPYKMTTDGSGNLIVADFSSASVKKLIPSGGYYINLPLPDGLNISNSTGIISGTPTIGSPATNYKVTAYNIGGGVAATVNIQVNKTASTDAYLRGLAMNGTLSPAFVKSTYLYTVAVANNVTDANVISTVNAAGSYITVNGTAVASGVPTENIPLALGTNTITVLVTAQNGTTTKTYTLMVTRAGLSTNAKLSAIKVTPATTLTVVSGPGYTNYTTPVPNSETSLTVTPTAQDPTATIKVNGVTVASGSPSQTILLGVGNNVINTVVTAQDGATTKTYIITATRAPSSVATLANLAMSTTTLSPVFASATTSYTATVPNATSSVKLTPMATDTGATIKINNVTVASGAMSASIPLAVGSNSITTVVTASNGTTTKTYTVMVTRAAAGLSTNAKLSAIKVTPATTLTVVSGPGYTNYTTPVPNSEASLTVTPTAQDATATIKVNGVAVASGTASAAIPLNVGDNVINTVVTAQDGATVKTYIITATRAAPGMVVHYAYASADSVKADNVIVHQGVSPNGDGNNDVLTIDGITNYPDNNISIMSRAGILVFEAKGYNNTSVVFDGHANKNGRLQQAGTYFYKLEYKDNGEVKTKTGFILLKY